MQKINTCLTELVPDSYREILPEVSHVRLLRRLAAEVWISSDLRSGKFPTDPEFDVAPETGGCLALTQEI